MRTRPYKTRRFYIYSNCARFGVQMSTSFMMKSKYDVSDPSAGQRGRTASNASRTVSIASEWRVRVDSRLQNSLDAKSTAAIWATRRFLIFERRDLLLLRPCSFMEAAIGFEVGKSARSDVTEKPLMMQLL